MFSKETYIDRRVALSASVSSELIVMLGNKEMPMNYTDNTYHFRQDSSFLYYFGLDQPALAGIIDADPGVAVLFGDEMTVEMIVWAGLRSYTCLKTVLFF
jgi:Xaa-Pro aminopeptidase